LQNTWLQKRGSDSKLYCRSLGSRREAATASYIAERLAPEERQRQQVILDNMDKEETEKAGLRKVHDKELPTF
jgi:hypothetical protein